MEAKHVAGPWIAQANRDSIDIEGYKRIVAAVPGTDDEAIDISRLIAAAPGLLATLEWTLEQLNTLTTDAYSKGGDRAIRDRLQEAIDRTRGQG